MDAVAQMVDTNAHTVDTIAQIVDKNAQTEDTIAKRGLTSWILLAQGPELLIMGDLSN